MPTITFSRDLSTSLKQTIDHLARLAPAA